MEHAARAELLLERRILGIVGQLRLFLGVQVIEVAEELVEAVHGRQVLVAIAEVVLAELAGGVAERLQQLGDRRILRLQADGRAGHADLGQAGADRVLAGDEGGAAGGAALLAVVVGEGDALVGDAVDVGGSVAHLAAAEVADVPHADVVAPEDQDVRFLRGRHVRSPPVSVDVRRRRNVVSSPWRHNGRASSDGRGTGFAQMAYAGLARGYATPGEPVSAPWSPLRW